MKLLSVSEFCERAGISRALFYKLAHEGKGPRTIKIGSRTLISEEAAQEWQLKMENRAVA